MANNIIQLVIAAKNEASGTLKQVKKDLSDLEKAQSKGVSGAGAFGGMGTVAGVAAFGVAVAATANYASKAAADYDRLKQGTDSLGRQYGLSASSILGSVESITQGTLSQGTILQQANQAMLLGVANTGEEFETLAKIAVDRGRKMGISMEKAFSSIVLGVGRLSPLILDNLGIVIDADNTYKAYAESIGKTAETLTDMEKRQALLSRLKSEMTDFDSSQVLDGAAAWERFNASVENSIVRLGDWINESGVVISAVSGLATVLNNASLVLFANDDDEKLKATELRIKGIQETLKQAQDEYNRLTSLSGLDKILNDPGGNNSAAQLEEMARLQGELTKASEEYYRRIMEAQRSAGVIAAENAADNKLIADETATAAIQQEKLNGLMGEYGKQMGLTKTEVSQMTDGLIAAEGSIDGAINRARQLVTELNNAAAAAAAVSSAMGGAYSALQGAAVEAYRNSGYSQDVIDSYNVQLGYLKNVEQTLLDSGVAEQNLAFYAVEAADAATEGFEAYNKQFEAITKSSGGAAQLTEEFRNLQSTVSGIFSDMFSDIGGVKVDDFLPREDAPNEAARRIADVMVKGFESPWADYFKTSFPDLFTKYMGEAGGDVKTAAGLLLRDFQSGLRPELIDTNVVKELAKRAFQVDQSTKAMIDQISRELADELGISIEEATGYASGAAGGAGLISKEAITKTNSELKFKPEFDMSNTKNDLLAAGKSAGLFNEAGNIMIKASVSITSVDIDPSTLGVVGIPTVPIVTGTPTTNAQKVLDMIGTVSAPVYLDYTKINGSPDAATNIETLIGRVETPVYLGVPTTESVQTWVNNIVAQVGSIGIPVTATPPADLSVVGPAFSPVYTEIHNALTARVPFTATDILSILSQTFADNVTQTQMMGLNLGINMYQGFAQYPLGAVLASELSRQVDEAQKSFENSGKNAGRKWGDAFLDVVGENVPIELLNILTDLITPEVQARLAGEGTR